MHRSAARIAALSNAELGFKGPVCACGLKYKLESIPTIQLGIELAGPIAIGRRAVNGAAGCCEYRNGLELHPCAVGRRSAFIAMNKQGNPESRSIFKEDCPLYLSAIK